MSREQNFLHTLNALRTASREANDVLDSVSSAQTSRVLDLNDRRQAIRAFRMRLAEMKWMCLQMEIVLSEAPFTRSACNDAHA